MKTQYRALTVLLALLVGPTMTFSADRKPANSDTANVKPATAVVQQLVAPTVKPKSPQVSTAVLNPLTGEQLKWQVVAGGGGASSSTNFKLSATVVQTAIGLVTSTNYETNLGFWQNLSTSCCVGKRGNVDCTGIIDLGDLTALVSYLNGGSFKLCCYDAANVDGVGIVDLGDLTALVSYLNGGGFVLLNCP